ncbi:MBL fold metallo-hydrolase [Deinococcus sonorensis]|uniref:MBL fold metallo-hydrolase n=2 Tax=Deinococcus sonorensis TaxID=309891 RepID=A0AAU7UCS9_9DEIO
MRLTSLGAAGTVSGSAHHLQLDGQQLLIDCGLFQGDEQTEQRNREPFPFEAAGLNAVLLTHAHLDHVGRLPLLYRRGFRGPIYCTPPTARLTATVLRDSARLQVDGYTQALKLARRIGQERTVPPPLYDEQDVDDVLTLMRPVLHYGQTLTLGQVRVRPERAGHILGSAFLVLDSREGRLVMSGDLGRQPSVLQPGYSLPPEADAVVVESTYGLSRHPTLPQTLAQLAEVLRQAVRRGGKILMPCFAIERTQVLLYLLHGLMERGELPRVPVFLDAPMAARATLSYAEYGAELRPELGAMLQAGLDPFRPSTLHVVTTPLESQRLNRYDGPAIILAGNGMMTGGRILHHLRHQLWKPSTTVVAVGYQSPSSLGGQLVGGAAEVEVLGEVVPVKAHIERVSGLSAHADQADLQRWLEPTGPAQVWLVHGEPEVMQGFAAVLEAAGRSARPVPAGQPVELSGAAVPAER